ncbi:MAG: hypothetical protein Tsb005_14270 [Gammaproteobacteria bacterium]
MICNVKSFAQSIEKNVPEYDGELLYSVEDIEEGGFFEKSITKATIQYKITANLAMNSYASRFLSMQPIYDEKTRKNVGYSCGKKESICNKIDIYQVIKLLPFNKKINALKTIENNKDYALLMKSIISDLVAEFFIFYKKKWNLEIKDEHLLRRLGKLNSLCHYDHAGLVAQKLPGSSFLSLVFAYLAIVNYISSKYDSKFINPRRYRLINLVEKELNQLLNKYKFDNVDTKFVKKLNEPVHKTINQANNKKDLLCKFITPYLNSSDTFSNNDPRLWQKKLEVKKVNQLYEQSTKERGQSNLLERFSFLNENQTIKNNKLNKEAALYESDCHYELNKPK